MLWFALGFWDADFLVDRLVGKGWGAHQLVDWDGRQALWVERIPNGLEVFVPEGDAWLQLSTHNRQVRTLAGADQVRAAVAPGARVHVCATHYSDPATVMARLLRAQLYLISVLKA